MTLCLGGCYTLCPIDVGMLKEEDVTMTLSVVSGMVTSRSMVDLDSACGAKHEDV